MSNQTRRQWLATTAGATATLPLLAGCMGSSDDDGDEADDTDDSDTEPTEENGLGVATGGGTWPMADFDAANTKVVEDHDGPEGPVEERWAVEMDDDLSEPVVAHDLVYVMEAGATLYAFDLATGDIEWELDRDGHERTATPAVTDDTVYFLTDELEALDPQTGDQQWSIDLPGSSSNGQIRVFDGTVYVAGGGSISAIDASEEELVWSEEASDHRDIAIDGDGNVYVARELVEREDWRWDSFDGDSGDHRWEYEPDEEIETPRSGVVIYDEKLYSLANEELLEFDTESGDVERLFEYRNLTTPARPVIVNDLAITSTDGSLDLQDPLLVYDLESEEGIDDFNVDTSSLDPYGPQVASDTLYVWQGAPGATDDLRAIDLETTEYKWEYDRAEKLGEPADVVGYAILEQSIVFSSDHAYNEVAVLESS